MQNRTERRGRPRKNKANGSDIKASPDHKNVCDKCGFNEFSSDGSCAICVYVKKKRNEIKCRLCSAASCDMFCDVCVGGYHLKCYSRAGHKLLEDEINNFTCVTCDAATFEEENDLCGECGEMFENPQTFTPGQDVLAEVHGNLYNAKIFAEEKKSNCVIVHFPGWSKRWDEKMDPDDERLHESLACDCCNLWFHVSCLPPFGNKGRSKDYLYVCVKCRKEAKTFSKQCSLVKNDGMKNKALAEENSEKKTITTSETQKEDMAAMPKEKRPRKRVDNSTKVSVLPAKENNGIEASTKCLTEQVTCVENIPPSPVPVTPPSNQKRKGELVESLTKWKKPWKKTSVSTAVKKSSILASNDADPSKRRKRAIPRQENKSQANKTPTPVSTPLPMSPEALIKTEPVVKIESPLKKDSHVAEAELSRPSLNHQISDTRTTVVSARMSLNSLSFLLNSPRGDVIKQEVKQENERSNWSKGVVKHISTSVAHEIATVSGNQSLYPHKSAPTSLQVLHAVAREKLAIGSLCSEKQPSAPGTPDPCECYDIDGYIRVDKRESNSLLTKKEDASLALRTEIYNAICDLEQRKYLSASAAKLLRMFTRPTSEMFKDLRFVYEVNKDKSSAQLSIRLSELAG